MSACIPCITGKVLADFSLAKFSREIVVGTLRSGDVCAWESWRKKQSIRQVVQVVPCRAMTAHTIGHLSLFQLGWDAFLKELSVPMYTAGSKFICEIPFPPLSSTVIVGWNSMGCAETAARQDDLYDFFFHPTIKRTGRAVSLLCVLLLDAIWHCVLWLSKVGSLPRFQPVLQV